MRWKKEKLEHRIISWTERTSETLGTKGSIVPGDNIFQKYVLKKNSRKYSSPVKIYHSKIFKTEENNWSMKRYFCGPIVKILKNANILH